MNAPSRAPLALARRCLGLLLLALSCGPLACPLAAAPEPKAETTGAFYENVTAAGFAAREAVQKAIDSEHFDAPLLAAAIFYQTNAVRAKHALAALAYNAQAETAAQKHTDAMAKGNFLSHGSPDPKKSTTPYERLKNEGLQPRFAAENVAFSFRLRYESGKPFFVREADGRRVYLYEPDGPPLQPYTYQSFAESIVQQWMDSPPHRKNLLSPEPTQIGVGAALAPNKNGFDQIYSTQNFLAPLP